MKQTKPHVILVGRAVQFAMSLVQFPGAGKHPAVFIRVGITEHDFLPASPGIQQGNILRISPEAAHHVGCRAQRVDRFKQRHRHQAWIIRRSRHLHPASASEPDDIDHVLLRFRSADYILPDGLRRMRTLQFRNHPESVQQFLALWRLRLAIEGRPELLNHLRMYAGMLTHIQGVKMKPELAKFPQQGTEIHVRQAFPAIGHEACLQQ